MIEENIKRSKKEEEKKTQTKRTRTRKENKTEKKGGLTLSLILLK